MATKDFNKMLDLYAQLIVKVGLNLQPGQKLVANGKSFTRGVAMEAAPLMRRIAHHAYLAGAKLVDVIWDDPELTMERIKYAPKDSFDEYPTWRTKGLAETVSAGNAMLTVYSEDPDLYKKQDAEIINKVQNVMQLNLAPTSEQLMLNTFNWSLDRKSVV